MAVESINIEADADPHGITITVTLRDYHGCRIDSGSVTIYTDDLVEMLRDRILSKD